MKIFTAIILRINKQTKPTIAEKNKKPARGNTFAFARNWVEIEDALAVFSASNWNKEPTLFIPVCWHNKPKLSHLLRVGKSHLTNLHIASEFEKLEKPHFKTSAMF